MRYIHKSRCLLILLFFTVGNTPAWAQLPERPVHVFDLNSIAGQDDCSWSEWPGRAGQLVRFAPRNERQRIILPGSDEGVEYASARYLVIQLEQYNPAATILLLDFLRNGDAPDADGWLKPRNSTRIGLLPGIKTQVIFPLSYLDAQQIFLPRVPRQLKGTFSGERLLAQDIDQVGLRIEHAQKGVHPESIYISGIQLLKDFPSPLTAHYKPWVDTLGQWMLKDWPGKVMGVPALAPAYEEARARFGQTEKSEKLSDYYGYQSLRFDSTGFFHTHHDGRRWWLVDPLGYAYLSVAPTGMSFVSDGPVQGNEDLFSYLPEDDEFREAQGFRNGSKTFSPLTMNLMRLLGPEWKSSWKSASVAFLNGLGFTGSGNWSDRFFIQGGPFPYVYPMHGFPRTPQQIFRDFPDVFDPEFAASCKQFAEQLRPLSTDRRMIGYFLGNEPHWAFGSFNLAREMLYTARDLASREALFSWLISRYGGIEELSSAWERSLQSEEDFRSLTFPRDEDISEMAMADLQVFTDTLIHRYTRLICDAVKEADPNHLNLGLRFAWISSEACFITGRYFDVFSLNGYTFPDPPETKRIRLELNKPVLLGEFHFGSTDRGLPATGIQGVASEKDRGIAYRRYVEQGFARPEIVGIHYFQWNDQPVTGRFDGENYNIGIVDVTFRPYPELARAIQKTNQRLFQVASGKVPAYRKKARTVPAIYY